MIIEGECTKEPEYALVCTSEVCATLTEQQIEDLLTCKPGSIVRVDPSIMRIKLNDA